MRNFLKIILFSILFSALFYFLRTQGPLGAYNIRLLISDLGGVTYLYSTIGIIFAIFAAFVILSESERWNELSDSVRGEISELNELLLWTKHLPQNTAVKFKSDIREYLEATVAEWNKRDTSRSERAI